MPSGAGPGAGSPKRRTNAVQVRRASIPVTSCSRIAGTSASKTRPLLLSRIPGSRRRVSRTTPGGSSRPVQSSSAPSNEGTASRAQSAPAAPCLGGDLACGRVGDEPNSGGTIRRPPCSPVRTVRPDAMARVVASAPVRTQRGVEVERPTRAVATLERQDARGQRHDSSLEKRTEPGSRTHTWPHPHTGQQLVAGSDVGPVADHDTVEHRARSDARTTPDHACPHPRTGHR